MDLKNNNKVLSMLFENQDLYIYIFFYSTTSVNDQYKFKHPSEKFGGIKCHGDTMLLNFALQQKPGCYYSIVFFIGFLSHTFLLANISTCHSRKSTGLNTMIIIWMASFH